MADRAIITTEDRALSAGQSETNPAAVYLASLRPTGRATMRSTLEKVADLVGMPLDVLPWPQLQYEHVAALRTKLAEQYKPATVNKYLCAIRGVMRAAWRLGQIDAEQYQRIADVKGVTGSTLPAGRGLDSGEVKGLMEACSNDPTPTGARDAAIISMGYAGGLRRAEIASLDVSNILGDDGEAITIKVVKGKRNKERMVYLDNGARLALLDWLAIRGDEPGALFWSGRRGGHLVRGQRLTGQAIGDILTKRAEIGGVEPCTPHDLRRSFVSDLLESGVDISTVANMAGHESVETTRRYDRRGEQAKKRAAKTLHVPYRRRMV